MAEDALVFQAFLPFGSALYRARFGEPPEVVDVPAISTRGLVVLALALVAGAMVVVRRTSRR